MKKSLFFCFIAFFVIFSSGLSLAGTPSFDCSKASTEVEKLICGDDELSMIDKDLATAYADVSSRLDDAGKAALKKAQIEWIKGRSKLVSEGLQSGLSADAIQKYKIAKLKEAYEKRMAELANTPIIVASIEKNKVEAVASGNEIWGVKLPLPDGAYDCSISLYKDRSDNLFIVYYYSFSDGAEGGASFFSFSSNHLIKHFSRHKTADYEASQKFNDELNALIKTNSLIEIKEHLHYPNVFSMLNNRFKAQQLFLETGNCSSPINGFLKIYDDEKKEFSEKMLVVHSGNPIKYSSSPNCWFISGKNKIKINVYSLYPRIWSVGDNSIIIHGSDSPFVIRFRPDMTSPFLLENNEIIWADKDQIIAAQSESKKKAEEFFKRNNKRTDGLLDGKSFIEHVDKLLSEEIKSTEAIK